jgi:hypothetical protein
MGWSPPIGQHAVPPPRLLRTVTPAPTDEEAAAIVAAIEALWPRAVVMPEGNGAPRASSWRFSGRWWARPVPARRDRPWY